MRTVLITGAARRIGRGIALALARHGWHIAAHYNSSEADVQSLLEEIHRGGGTAVAMKADLDNPTATEALVPRCIEALGSVHCLINNASLFELDRIDTLTAAAWDRHMAVNLRAPAFLARDLARHLEDGESGCIINLVDQKLWNLNPDFLSYTVSKVALQGLTEVLAMAFGPRIRVCSIAPGLTLPSGLQSQAQFERVHKQVPLGRGATVDDIAAAVTFVLGLPTLTGQTLLVDGGQHLDRQPRDVMFEA